MSTVFERVKGLIPPVFNFITGLVKKISVTNNTKSTHIPVWYDFLKAFFGYFVTAFFGYFLAAFLKCDVLLHGYPDFEAV